jgi:hypothetical protein
MSFTLGAVADVSVLYCYLQVADMNLCRSFLLAFSHI